MTEKVTGKAPRYIFIIAIIIMAVVLLALTSPKRTSGDFDVYYAATKNYLAKAPIYIVQEGIEEFKYSPLFTLMFSPLTIVSRVPALYLWNMLNIFLLFMMFFLLCQLKEISFYRFKSLFLIGILFVLNSRFIFSNIKIGQVNIVLCFLLVLTIYLAIKKKDFWASLPLALSLTVKFFPLLFLAYFVLRRRFKIVSYTFFLVGIFLLLPSLYTGLELNFKYLSEWFSLLKATPSIMYYSVKNNSLLSFFSWFFIARHEPYAIFEYTKIVKALSPQVYYAWIGSGLVLGGLFFFDIFSRKQEQKVVFLDYACLFILVFLLNPLAYLNALIFLIIPYFFILHYLFYLKTNKAWKGVICFFCLISFVLSIASKRSFFPDIQHYYFYLEYKFPMWGAMLVYLNLLLIKISLVLKLRRRTSLVG